MASVLVVVVVVNVGATVSEKGVTEHFRAFCHKIKVLGNQK